MIFTATLDSICPGNNHFEFTITVGARSVPLRLNRDELQTDATDVESKIKDRLISFVKEADVLTVVGIRAALAVKEFKI